MSYKSLRGALEDLERDGQLLRVREEIDPHLEMAEIQRRAYLAEAPAILYENVKGSPFQAVSNPLRHPRARALLVPRHARARSESYPAQS